MSKFNERGSRINDLNAQIIPSRLKRFNYGAEYLIEAVQSFHREMPISCIVVSSALVERTLFWQKLKVHPPRTFREGNLGRFFIEFMDLDILLTSLLDTDEQLDLKLKRERGVERRKIEKTISNARYVETRNTFAHGKELLLPMPLTQLLPANSYASSEYSINSKEWWNPTLSTIAYVHLSKTLRFMKAFTDLLNARNIE